MPLYASGGFENGDLNDRPAPPPAAPPPPPPPRVPEYGPPSAGESSQPPLPPRPAPPRPSPIIFKDAESASNWRPKARGEDPPLGWRPEPDPKELPLDMFLKGLPPGSFEYTGPGARFGPNGEVYMLPGETPDMFECDLCGKPGHRASVCAYKYKFPPDGHIARPDWYEVICWCGSLNISPDPPRKCNRCDNGGNALMVRSKQPPYYYGSTDSPGSTLHFTSRESLVPYFRPYKPPPPESLYGPVGRNVMF